MRISHDCSTVSFKTEPRELFEAEKSGLKQNMVRILDIDEYHQLRKANPKKIIVQYQQEIFLRAITHTHVTEIIFGKVIVVISWRDDVSPHSVPVEPGPHNASVESVPEMPTMPPICKCANCVWGVREEGESSSRIYMSKIPIAKTMRCPDCDGGLLKSRAGEFGKCTICQALFRVEERGAKHD